MKISILQFKSELGNVQKNFNKAKNFIELAKNSDVIILPELWTTGYYPQPIQNFAENNCDFTKNFISQLAKKFSVNIIAGSIIAKENDKIFNRSLIFNRKGEILNFYDKTHLFSYAGEEKIFSAGNEIKIFELDGVKCGIAICYDLRFPEFIRKICLQGIEILFCPAAWSLKRNFPRKILTAARAIENQIFVVFANSAGNSEILNPLGEIISAADIGDEILTADVDFDFRKKVIAKMNLFADRNLLTDS